MRRVVFIAWAFSLSDDESSEQQSLIVGTMISVSLRTKSAPREFLTGPMGAETTGRFLLDRVRKLLVVGSRSLEDGRRFPSSPARKVSIAAMFMLNCGSKRGDNGSEVVVV